MMLYSVVASLLLRLAPEPESSPPDPDPIVSGPLLQMVSKIFSLPFDFAYSLVDSVVSLFFAMTTCTSMLWIVFALLHGQETANQIMNSVGDLLFRKFQSFFR